MSELKFTCPLCGQRMECEKAYVGDAIQCPGCAAELRVPFSHSPLDPITALPRAELIKSSDGSFSQIAGQTDENPFAESNQSKTAVARIGTRSSAEDGGSSSTQDAQQFHLRCPVCHSELNWPQDFHDYSEPTQVSQSAGALSDKTPITEREKQIAAAREAHPVSVYPSIKPRLSFILSGGESVSEADESLGEKPHEDPSSRGSGAE